jgi:hypothetical protein
MKLVVTMPFTLDGKNYKHGEEITEQDEIEAVLASDSARSVVKVAA